ncbi:MAG: hypothetical protein FWG45_06705 [Oscillospiraceae bacterium]|nr:hypothetical protein [Oscillospiraceae bacterium]
MKKIIALWLAIMLILTMVTGCDRTPETIDTVTPSDTETTDTDDGTPPPTSPVIPPPPGTLEEQLIGSWACTPHEGKCNWYCNLTFSAIGTNGRFTDEDGDAGMFRVRDDEGKIYFDYDTQGNTSYPYEYEGGDTLTLHTTGEGDNGIRVLKRNGGSPDEVKIAPELVGSWSWAETDREWYVLYADGMGKMYELGGLVDIQWGAHSGVFFVCKHPEFCKSAVTCIGATKNEYTLDGDILTLSIGGRDYSFIRTAS